MKQRLVILLLLLLFPAQVQALEESTTQSVTLQLNGTYRFEFAGYIAAKEKGFFRDAGLDVRKVSRILKAWLIIPEKGEGGRFNGPWRRKSSLKSAKGYPLQCVMISSLFHILKRES